MKSGIKELAKRLESKGQDSGNQSGWNDIEHHTETIDPAYLPDSYDPEKRLAGALRAIADDASSADTQYQSAIAQIQQLKHTVEAQDFLYNVTKDFQKLVYKTLENFRNGHPDWKQKFISQFRNIHRARDMERKKRKLFVSFSELTSFRVLNSLAEEAIEPSDKSRNYVDVPDVGNVSLKELLDKHRTKTNYPITETSPVKTVIPHEPDRTGFSETGLADNTFTNNNSSTMKSPGTKISAVVNLAKKIAQKSFEPEELELEDHSAPEDDDYTPEHPLNGMPVAPNKSNYSVLTEPVSNYTDEEMSHFQKKVLKLFSAHVDEFNSIKAAIKEIDTFGADMELHTFINKSRAQIRKALYDLMRWHNFSGAKNLEDIQSHLSEMKESVQIAADVRHALLTTWDAKRSDNLDEETVRMISRLSRAADRCQKLGNTIVSDLEDAISASFKKHQGGDVYEFEDGE